MVRYRILQLLFLVSSMTSQALIKGMMPEQKEIGEGIAQKIEELPRELRYDIFSSALALRENPKYEVYKKFNVDSVVKGIVLNADNTRALTGSFEGVVRIWDVKKGKVLKELKSHDDSISSVSLSVDGTIALTSSLDKTARVWNALTGELLKTLEVGSSVYSAALSADGTLALTGSHDTIARLYNASTGELLKELKGHTGPILSVALSADGTLAFTGSEDGTARVWNALTGELFKTLQVGSEVTSVALSADGTIALTGIANNSKVFVWDAQSGSLLNTLLTNSLYIYSIVLSKDGKRALVGTDNNIQVWNTKPLPGKKETRTPLRVLESHTAPIASLAFGSADFIASSLYDGTVIIWKPYALELRAPQEHEEVLRQAYKETFSRPLLRSADGN